MTPLIPATLTLDEEGIPYAPAYGDIYHSRAGGYAQAREVFVAGNGLPEAWAGRRNFVILETGFGLGTNFLATWAAWRASTRRCRRLHYVSVELHPFSASDLRAWHGREGGEMAALGGQLADAWPVLTPGLHRIELEGGRVVLTLAFGDALEVLPQLRLRADVFYPDGFSPRRNPELWSEEVFTQFARLAAPGATLATYTVAHKVVRRLTEAGFALRPAPGFGGKNDMLLGRYAGAVPLPVPVYSEERALVIGAGIAGVMAADSLAARGWEVDILDSEDAVARGASSTPAGALHTMLARDDSRQARFTRAAYLWMRRRLAALAGPDADWAATVGRLDCLEEGDTEAQMASAASMLDGLGFPREYVRLVDAREASALVGARVARGGYWFEGGAWLQASAFCKAVLAARKGITWKGGRPVAALRRVDGLWQALNAAGEVIAAAPMVVLAAGLDLPRLAQSASGDVAQGVQMLPLQTLRGQLTGIPQAQVRAPRALVSGEGYCLPPVHGMVWTGASYGPDDVDLTEREADHAYNLRRLAALLPDNDLGANVEHVGHVGLRAVAPDRLPFAGALPDVAAIAAMTHRPGGPPLAGMPRLPGLYASGAMASRGLTWAALAGEIIASAVEQEPAPVESDLLDAVDPARFLQRALRRGANQ